MVYMKWYSLHSWSSIHWRNILQQTWKHQWAKETTWALDEARTLSTLMRKAWKGDFHEGCPILPRISNCAETVYTHRRTSTIDLLLARLEMVLQPPLHLPHAWFCHRLLGLMGLETPNSGRVYTAKNIAKQMWNAKLRMVENRICTFNMGLLKSVPTSAYTRRIISIQNQLIGCSMCFSSPQK